MKKHYKRLRSTLPTLDLSFLADVPYVYHCHHYNLFHDQTVDDALGEELGTQIRMKAMRNTIHPLLQRVSDGLGAETPIERLSLAIDLFAWMGHGTLHFSVDEAGGTVEGNFLHYGHGWREKYGSRMRRFHPADSVAAGYSAAATEVAFRLPMGSIEAVEEKCISMREPSCRFRLKRQKAEKVLEEVRKDTVAPNCAKSFPGKDEERITAIAKGLVEFLSVVQGDERGLIQAFSVFVTLHLSNYYNETIYKVIGHIEENMPENLAVGEALFREAGQVCVFNTFGNILLSPEWEGLVGPLSGEPSDIISFCAAIARGLSFGHWTIEEYIPETQLVLRAPSHYEAPFYMQRYPKSDKPRCYILQGAALAIMVLAHSVSWKETPQLTNDFYISLFRSELPWKVKQTKCQTMGDPYNEVVVYPL